MEQYIPKSALVAEIERRIELNNTCQKISGGNEFYRGAIDEAKEILSFTDTLEVKEVDLEKEIDKFYGMYRKDGQTFSLEDNQECLDWKVDCNPDFEIAFAKYFYELGMCAANPLTAKDIEKIYHLVNEVSDDLGVRAMYVNIYKETLKRFKDFKEMKEKCQ